MAYSRWVDNPYYVYWHANFSPVTGAYEPSSKKDEQLLAVWHVSAGTPIFTYPQIKEIMESEYYTALPGFSETEKKFQDILLKNIGEWMFDVEEEFPDAK